jgi:threonine/homoserine/homoserine lactone efflux protein
VDLRLWLFFLATEVVLILIPGPAVLLVVSDALRLGAVHALWSNAGIVAANALYFLLSAAGLGVILLTHPGVFVAVRWSGAAYLGVIGLRALLRPEGGVGEATRAEVRAPRGRSFGGAFLTQASNPGSLVFFSSILPQFLDARRPLGTQMLILGATSLLAEAVILAGYGFLADRAIRRMRDPRFTRVLSRASGVLLLAAALGLALLRR